jgi:glyoxylase-like metal-dependent hydrolase (beta-lactamase superfamily II)
MRINAFTNSLFSSVSYLLIDENRAWIVDVGDTDSIIQYIKNNNLSLEGILLTHGHFDHIYGLNDIISSFPTVPVYTNEFGARMLVSAKLNMSKYHEMPFEFKYPKNVVIIEDATEIEPFKVYETPGHNPSCLSFVTDSAIFTGDAYIPGLNVVTNLPKGNKVQAQHSIKKILELANSRTVYPGHSLSSCNA